LCYNFVMRSRGMTLMELLIVLAVLALLMGIALFSFRGFQNEGQKAKAQGDLRTIRLAIESYNKNHNSQYPNLTNYMTTLLISVPQILDHPVYDPFGPTATTPYTYAISGSDPSNSRYFVVYSVGSSGLGTAAVDNNGQLTVSNDAIWDSNGRL
jgi:prepilin-type N-terminal cleavage/methylation domain-containing protein